jgi:hypothetical protein
MKTQSRKRPNPSVVEATLNGIAEDRLRAAERNYQEALATAEDLRYERDDAIRDLIKRGASHAEIHRLLDGSLTRARIGQIALHQ